MTGPESKFNTKYPFTVKQNGFLIYFMKMLMVLVSVIEKFLVSFANHYIYRRELTSETYNRSTDHKAWVIKTRWVGFEL